MGALAAWGLVGRAAELQALAAAIAGDGPRGAVLVGSRGVGKTRLATEALRLGEEAGHATARVSATASAAELPLGAFATLLPELGGASVDLLAAARRVLHERRGDGQLVLLVDDAHLLDDVSATLLLHLAGDPNVFVLVTVRRGEKVPDAVTALWKDGHARRIEVQTLPDADMDDLCAEILGGPVDDSTAARLRTYADGNPLALREVVLGAVESGALVQEDGRWWMPAGLTLSHRLIELVGERIGNLADDERTALELVVLGEPLGPDLLAGIVGEDALAALEERQLVEVRPDGKRIEVWLSHPLHGEVVRTQMPVLRRRKLLRQVADALATSGNRRRGDVLRLATWRLELGDTGDAELLLEAARQAYVALDLQRSAELAEASWQAARSVEAGYLLGTVRSQLSEHEAAEAVLADVERRAEDDRTRLLVAVARSENLFRMDRYDDAVAVVDAADAALEGRTWRDELAGHRATLVMLHGSPAEAMRIVEPLLESEDSRTFVEAAIAGATSAAHDGRPLDAIDLSRRAHAVHLGIWDDELFQSDPGVHLYSQLLALINAGQLSEAEDMARLIYEVTVQNQRGTAQASIALQIGLVLTERGKPSSALAWLQRSSELFAKHGPAQRRRFALAGLVQAAALLADVELGRDAEIELQAHAGSALRFTLPRELVARGWLASADRRPNDAQDLLDEAYELGMSTGERSASCLALHTMARQGRPERAADRVPTLADHVQGVLLHARLDHVVAATRSDGDALADVAQRFAVLGATLCAAEAMADAARARRKEGSAREARLLANHARSLAAQCEGAITPTLAMADEAVPLSKREREVAMLAAGGLATKEIAARLYLSPRTVENHLQRAYEKLGTSGRAELSAALGLLPD